MPNGSRNEPERLWTAEDVAAFLGLHPQTVYAKSRAGEIPSHKIGRSLRFRPSEVQAWVEEQARSTPTDGTG